MRPVRMLPTLVTLGNLFCGFLAIAYLTDSLEEPTAAARMALYERSVFLIFLAMVFDMMDGMVARLTGQASDFGAQVDSICDAVSFGAAPALLFKVMAEAEPEVVKPKVALVLAILFLACAVLRLARFNLEADDGAQSHQWFEGLPTPAAAAVVASLAYANVELDPDSGDSWIRHALPFLIPLVAFLMVSRLPFLHVGSWLSKRKSYANLVVLLFIAGFVVMKHDFMVPLLCVGYMLSGPVRFLWRHFTGHREDAPLV
jgi:CDP-diacylglycerol--serine O-phosphatidyltransferase